MDGVNVDNMHWQFIEASSIESFFVRVKIQFS